MIRFTSQSSKRTAFSYLCRKFSVSKAVSQKKAALVLSGCGTFDGSDVHQVAATVVHLTKKNIEPYFFAPEVAQAHVVNHIKGEETCEVRCVMTESARITRGVIRPLAQLTANDFDALIFPGGFGAAKNLSSFAQMGAHCTVNIEVCRVITEFHKCKKPIALMCIAPILVARVIPCVTITLGRKDECGATCPRKWPHHEAIDTAVLMGANVEYKDVKEVSIDKENLILSTPANMYNGKFHEIFEGIGTMVAYLDCIVRGTYKMN